MPGLSTPINRPAIDHIVDEALELWPKGSRGLPEIGVYWNCKSEADNDAD